MSSNPSSIVLNPNPSFRIYLTANDGDHGVELYTFAPNAGEPKPTLVRDIHPGASSHPDQLTPLGDSVFFVADDGFVGRELWKSRGTLASTELVADIRTGGESSNPSSLTVMNGVLYFTATDDNEREVLLSFDPDTDASPQLIDLPFDADLGEIVLHGYEEMEDDESVIYVAAVDRGGRAVLFEYSPIAPEGIIEIETGPFEYSQATWLTQFGDHIYFSARHPSLGVELVQFDPYGEPSSNLRVFDLHPGAASSRPVDLYVYPAFEVKATLQFSADDGEHGRELFNYLPFSMDQPQLLADILAGAAGSSPSNFFPSSADQVAFFSAQDDDGRPRLWQFPARTEFTVDIGAVERYTSSVSGFAFHDANTNQRRDVNELGLGGWTIYADLNDNGKLDPFEPQSVTAFDDLSTALIDETGGYELTGLDPGSYKLRAVIPRRQQRHFEPTTPQVPVVSAPYRLSQLAATGTVSTDELAVRFSTFAGSPIVSRGVRVFQDHESRLFASLSDSQDLVTFLAGPESTEPRNGTPLGTIGDFFSDGLSIAFDALGRTEIFVTRDGSIESLIDESTPLNDDGETFGDFELFVRDYDAGVIAFEARQVNDGELRQEFFAVSLEGTLSLLANHDAVFYDQELDAYTGFDEIRGVDLGIGYAVEGAMHDSPFGIYLGDDPFSLRAVVKNDTAIPSGLGAFISVGQFSLAEGKVAFRGQGERQQDGIYLGTKPLDLVRVVDTVTPIPDGSGVFERVGDFAYDGDTVAFIGHGNGQQQGIYVGGEQGAIRKLVDRSDVASFGGKTPRDFRISKDALNNGEIVFHVTFDDNSEAIFVGTVDTEFAHRITLDIGDQLEQISFGGRAATAEIRGKIFGDSDESGHFDGGEVGLANWTVYLDQNANKLLDANEISVSSDTAGNYVLAGLTPLQNYSVRIVPQNGWNQTARDGIETTDQSVFLDAGERRVSVDFGMREVNNSGAGGTGAIEVTVYEDINGNGLRDPALGETGLANQRVYLDKNDDGVRNGNEPFGRTDGSGKYTFERLTVGTTHVLRLLESDHTGFAQTSPKGNSFSRIIENVGDLPSAIAVVQQAGSAHHDLVVARKDANLVSIMHDPLGDDRNDFVRPVDASPVAISVADFDGDGSDDFAVANEDVDNVSIWLGTPLREPSIAEPWSVGRRPRALVSGDLDNDGDVDLAVANSRSDDVTILLNDGNAVFSKAFTIANVGDTPSGIAVLHLDGDSLLDIAVSLRNDGRVALLRNNGDGDFALFDAISVDANPIALTVAQLNDDNDDGVVDERDRTDLAVASLATGRVTILTTRPGNQQGFTRRNLIVGDGPTSIVSTDIDADGDQDLVAAVGEEAKGFISILRNQGNGVFQAPEFAGEAVLRFASVPLGLAAGDLDGDNDVDLALANGVGNGITVLRNNITSGGLRLRVTSDVTVRSSFALQQTNALPTLNRPDDLTISRRVPLRLSGISAGGGEDQEIDVDVIAQPDQRVNVSVEYRPLDDSWQLLLEPASNQLGTAIVTVTVSDAGPDGQLHTDDDGSSSQSFRVTVVENPAPVAVPDEFLVPAGATNFVLDVLRNDHAANPDIGEGLVVFRASQLPPDVGTLEINSDGSALVVSLEPTATGSFVLNYFVSDASTPERGTVTVVVGDQNVAGDFDGDGVLTNLDIDDLSSAIRAGLTLPVHDLNGDGRVDRQDRDTWISDLRETFVGDANLDGEFNTADLVTIFVVNKFESGQPAGWAEGDWNGNGTFDSADIVSAFVAGRFEQGPAALKRFAHAIEAVFMELPCRSPVNKRCDHP